MSVKISELIRNPALRGLRASLYVDISDTIDVMPSGFTYTCGDFSPWFISFPVMVIKKFYFFWENDHHHPFYEYFFGSDYIRCIPQYLRFTYTCGVFVPHGSSPFSDGFNREMESSPPFTDPSLREVPIGGYFLHSWPAYSADSTSLGRYRPSVRMASGNAILAPSLW